VPRGSILGSEPVLPQFALLHLCTVLHSVLRIILAGINCRQPSSSARVPTSCKGSDPNWMHQINQRQLYPSSHTQVYFPCQPDHHQTSRTRSAPHSRHCHSYCRRLLVKPRIRRHGAGGAALCHGELCHYHLRAPVARCFPSGISLALPQWCGFTGINFTSDLGSNNMTLHCNVSFGSSTSSTCPALDRWSVTPNIGLD